MINKENKYKKELFELFKNDLQTISEDEKILGLLKEVFLTDTIDINTEEILDKLTSNE